MIRFELEWFCAEEEAERWHAYWVKETMDWLLSMGLSKENLKEVKVPKDDLAHYAKLGTDIYYK